MYVYLDFIHQVCNECGKMVNTYASLALHKKKLHGNEKDDPKEKIKPFKCDECGRSFGSKGHLNEHTLGMCAYFGFLNLI